jgi:hypothetical protein
VIRKALQNFGPPLAFLACFILIALACEQSRAPQGVDASPHKLGSANAAVLSFTSSGTYTASKSFAIICGCGGGGGGAGGATPLEVGTTPSSGAPGGSGGGTGVYSCVMTSPTPGTAYTVTVGAGGAGGAGVAAGNGANGSNGSDGSDTTVGALATFTGAGKGYIATSINTSSNFAFTPGGWPVRNATITGITPGALVPTTMAQTISPQPFQGGPSFYGNGGASVSAFGGVLSPQGFSPSSGGSNGTNASTSFGGGGGGGVSGSGFSSCTSAAGGNGGNGNSAGVGVTGLAGKRQDGTTGTAALTTGTCCGGGGGGSGGQGSGANVSGAGGAGGGGDSGRAVVIEFQ